MQKKEHHYFINITIYDAVMAFPRVYVLEYIYEFTILTTNNT